MNFKSSDYMMTADEIHSTLSANMPLLSNTPEADLEIDSFDIFSDLNVQGNHSPEVHQKW